MFPQQGGFQPGMGGMHGAQQPQQQLQGMVLAPQGVLAMMPDMAALTGGGMVSKRKREMDE
jgi:hypothetical protein